MKYLRYIGSSCSSKLLVLKAFIFRFLRLQNPTINIFTISLLLQLASFDSIGDGISDISDPCPFNDSAFIDGCGNCVGGDTGEMPCTINVSGFVLWSSNCERPAIIKFYDSETSELVEESEILLNASGDFVTTVDSVGEYDIFLKVEGFLQTAIFSVNINEDFNLFSFGSIIFGDIFNDNQISIQDYALFSVTYGLSSTQDGYLHLADSDCDGIIDIQDFSIFVANYGLEGLTPE
ncbi:MAG: hypothetical protein ABR574_10895 [Cryomorphaceae bacterium]|nr:hypothetical protein [Flavobacteriales bacterium]